MTTLTITHDVDTLGALLAQIDALTTRANAIKASNSMMESSP